MDITYIPMTKGLVYLAVVLDWFSRRVLRSAWPARRGRDNVFVERLWRTVKHEEVYLHAYESVPDARVSIRRYLDLYNRHRPHSSLDGMTPNQAYCGVHNCRQSAWRPNPGRRSTYRSGNSVRTNGPPQWLA
jgi:transposase InsO family protein